MVADDHGHIPYIAILLHHLEEWKKKNDDKVPETYKEKTEFRNLVKEAIRTDNPEGGEENYDEAVSAVLKSLNYPNPSSSVKEILKAPECVIIRENSAPFWIIAHAIGLFYTKYGVLPVPGAVPDMKARSADYIQLQNIYKSKARKDLAEVLESVRFLERTANTSTQIDEKDVEAFCKNAAHIKLVRGRPFHIVPLEGDLAWGSNAKQLGKSYHRTSTNLSAYLTFHLSKKPHRPRLPLTHLHRLPRLGQIYLYPLPRRPRRCQQAPRPIRRRPRSRHRKGHQHRPQARRRPHQTGTVHDRTRRMGCYQGANWRASARAGAGGRR